ncbi:PTS sugar transporter subunit IIB [Clostridium algoriphilum]|uniref:PTS sugar transporter subunit IIB n=1 Tax=Clostridium algoriphilum TaxID=198347 RepID=UPI001CF0F923|nr:PTS sugar transporter subunit IIB [Clostridium algoriphilum]MCB2294503.1 PTS sugar transporter subunit IIB [Clostridium algoriphilum]
MYNIAYKNILEIIVINSIGKTYRRYLLYGDGYRIDDCLIHGPVATVWAKATKIEWVLVVIVMVACDELQKFLLKQASPPGVKSNVITIRKLIEIYHNY